MSGSGGGGWESNEPIATDCTTISIRTHVTSPNPAVLATISVGDILDISITPPSGPLVAATNTGAILGTVLTARLVDLVNCIKAGHSYQAEVTRITGADCEILITHI